VRFKIQRWQVELAALLVLMTLAFYWARWVLFPGTALHNEMLRFLMGDIAFLFLQVLLVTVFIDRVAQQREREEMRQKLNMVVGAFFSQVGTRLLGRLATADGDLGQIRDDLVPRSGWTATQYSAATRAFTNHHPRIDLSGCDLRELKALLLAEKSYLLGLLGNQSLLEHEQFTDLLWAITHLAEELEARPDLDHLPAADGAHLAGDVRRAYALLGEQWLSYLLHLQTHYPYLFSLAARTNPLDPSAQVTVKES